MKTMTTMKLPSALFLLAHKVRKPVMPSRADKHRGYSRKGVRHNLNRGSCGEE